MIGNDTSLNPISEEGCLSGFHFPKALRGHRHESLWVHHFQWESMGCDSGYVKKRNQNLSLWPVVAVRRSASIYGICEVQKREN